MKRSLLIISAILLLASCEFDFDVRNDSKPGLYVACVASSDTVSVRVDYASPLGVNANDMPKVHPTAIEVLQDGKALRQVQQRDGIYFFEADNAAGAEISVKLATDSFGSVSGRTKVPSADIAFEKFELEQVDMMGVKMNNFTLQLESQPKEGEYVGVFLTELTQKKEQEDYAEDNDKVKYLRPMMGASTNPQVELAQVDFRAPYMISTGIVERGDAQHFTIIPAQAFVKGIYTLTVMDMSALRPGKPDDKTDDAGSEDAAPVRYGLDVYSVSEEFYRYSLALYKSKSDFLAQMGLAPAQFAWSNMDRGYGFCGAVNRCFYLEFTREDILVLAAE